MLSPPTIVFRLGFDDHRLVVASISEHNVASKAVPTTVAVFAVSALCAAISALTHAHR